jgi:hypothetical protein
VSTSATFSLQQGNLYETVGTTKTLIDTNVQSYGTGSLGSTNYVFDLNNGGLVKDFNGSKWTNLTGSNTSVSEIGATKGSLYMLASNNGSNDSVWKYSGSGTSWTALTGSNTNVSEIATVGTSLYMLGNNNGTYNSVWKYSGSGTSWTALTGSNTNASQIAATSSSLYMVASNGGHDGVYKYSGSGTNWSALTGSNTSVSQIATINSTLYMVANNGGHDGVYKYSGSGTNWTALTGSNTEVYQIVAEGTTLYMVASNGGSPSVWQYSGSGTSWTALTGSALQKALGTWALTTSQPVAAAGYSAVSGTLFGPSGPTFLDVEQGYLGDCWYLSSLAATAARYPGDISSMFIYDGSTVQNGAQVGVYTVRFYDGNGIAHYYTVDTELPGGGTYYDMPVGGSGPVNGSSSKVLWVALAEKAYAEASAQGFVTTGAVGTNAYAAMDGGDPAWALQAITGWPASDYNINPSDIATAWNNGQIIVICTPNQPTSSYIVGDHAYAVVNYDPSNSLPFEAFNPWGTDANGWAPGCSGTIYGLFNANAAFLSQNFDMETFGSGAAVGGNGASTHGSSTGAQPASPALDGAALDLTGTSAEAQAGLASQLLALHRQTDALDAVFTDIGA